MKASELDFSQEKFSKEEFPYGVLEKMDATIISTLFDIRNALPDNHPLFPSPVYGAHVRDDNSGSRHNTRGGRLADATDFFCLRSQLPRVLHEVVKNPRVHGFGVYRGSMFRGEVDKYVMIHIDTRPKNQSIMWAADKVSGSYKYHYLHKEPAKYFEILSDLCS